MKKRSIISLLCCMVVLVMMVSLFAGCGAQPAADTKSDASVTEAAKDSSKDAPKVEDKKGVTITVASSAGWTRDVDKQLAELFAKETGNKIDFQISPDDQYSNVLKSKFATGEGPDVYLVRAGVAMNEFQPEQHSLDLSGEPWVARLTDWAKAGSTFNGKIVQFNTWSVDGWGFLYNPEIFKAAGITAVPTNYAELLKACEAIKAKGFTPIYEPGKAEWHQEIWLNAISAQAAKATPGLYEQLNANKAKIADQKGLETALSQMKELNDKGYFGKDFMANTWETMVDNMASGKFAMGLVYTSFQNEVLAKNKDTKADTWEMFPAPLNDNKVFANSAGGIGRSINKDSKVIDAAKAYFNFLSKVENLKTYYAARTDLGNVSFKDALGVTTKSYETVMKYSTDGAGLDAESGIQFWNQGTIGKLIQEMYLGAKTPKQVLEGIDADRAKMFK